MSGDHYPRLGCLVHLGLMVARLLRGAPGSPSVPPVGELSCCMAPSSLLPTSGSALTPWLGALRVVTGILQTLASPQDGDTFPPTWGQWGEALPPTSVLGP